MHDPKPRDERSNATCDTCHRAGLVLDGENAPRGWFFVVTHVADDPRRPHHVLACSKECRDRFPWSIQP